MASLLSSASAATVWLCGLSDAGIHLVCVADADPADDASSSTAAATWVRGTRFPLDPSRSYTVDLSSPPSDLALVQQLAQATICHRSPDCTALVAPSAWLAPVALAAPGRRAAVKR